MKIVLSGFYGLGNTGDEAILKAIVDNLRVELDNPDITVFSLSPENTAKEHNVKSIYRGWRHQNKEKVQALREADLLVSGGGGLLQDTYPTKFLFGPLPYYLLIVFLAKLCGAKVMFFSQGIGPVTSTWGKILMKVFANMADFVTVRDSYSKEYLHSLGVKRPETVVTADIVFAFQADQDDIAYESLALTGNEKIVAVTVRPWFDHPDYIEKMAHVLDALIEERGVLPVFVPMEGKYDVPASNDVLSLMKHADKTRMLGSDYTPNQFLNFIQHADLTIGLRLHALIFSALSNVPHLGFSYDKKVESFLKRSGMWDYSFRLGEIDEQKLLQNALYLLDNKDTAQQTMEPNVEALRQEARRNVTLLKEKFGK
ncbi:polysaccharide pyruvyl transferase CsaB [Paenisporosarcina cavernae]|uniref:Polysaccharide pyruvyl transferase CsaB n=1 Tax=Paenisporosarcina cavernae TaxID=2320858 RepID=A0A385YQZ9_9BACL|nr:polysaccharide pyruvyl transferase CsaB [Paenisporosarcina cavernae]AYC28911.1 polysaccharide pyruvyl transferase CsaB [Paenisporosarcina cavernae]